MELQTFAAGGRASEIIGEKALNHDREFRRLGMVYAAEIAEKEMEKERLARLDIADSLLNALPQNGGSSIKTCFLL